MVKLSLSSSLHLRSIKKHTIDDGNVSARIIKTSADTFAEIISVCENIGVTRISDITDTIACIYPTIVFFLPGTEDYHMGL